MTEAALSDIRRALLATDALRGERLLREIERRSSRGSPEGLLPRSVLYREIEASLRAAFPKRLAELLALVRRMVWPHGVGGNGFHVDVSEAREGAVVPEADVHATLTVLDGERPGMVYVLPVERMPMEAGRRLDADLVVRNRFMSKRHALFSLDAEGRITVEDLGTTGGTWIGGQIIRGPTALKDRDLVRFGTAELLFLAAIREPL